MPKVGNLGLEMMQATCTVQVNLDFSSEEQMVKMFRVSLALQPIATALWANSPFFEGKPNGYKSLRSAIWLDTDADRTGMLPFVFENGFGFERYVDYLLDVPMYFIKRDGNYIDATGGTFRQFLAHKHEKLIGHDATIDDFLDHTTTVFPEVRLKQYLEMRGSDASRWKSINALPAFWVGLLYDDECLEQAWQYVKDWTDEERDYLRRNVPKHALNTEFRNKSVKNIAMDIVKIAYKGLKRRNVIANNGMDETVYLQFLLSMANSGMTQADELLCAYKNLWNEDVKRIYKEYSF